jgi:MFS transporter, ACS family, D-galactonate transporter
VIRWSICILLAFGTLVSYFDRINLAVGTSSISKEFGVTMVEMGFAAAAFNYLYTFLQIPMGGILDRFGVTKILRFSTIIWAISTLLSGFVTSLSTLTGLRIILGASESHGMLATSKAIGYWFPKNERVFATSINISMTKFSSVIGLPFMAFIITMWGWRACFIVTGILSVLYSLLFWIYYRDPNSHTKIKKKELDYILQGGAQAEGLAEGSFKENLLYLLKQRTIWGLTLGYACYGYVFWLFLTWLPTYMVQELHMSILKSGLYTSIPYIGATITNIGISWFVDYLVRKGKNATIVQKTVLITSMILGLTIVFATQTTNPAWAVFWITFSMSSLSPSVPSLWAITSIIAPKGMVGTAVGILNCGTNIMSILAPIATAYIVQMTGSFSGGFLTAACVLVGGILSYIFLLGKIEPIVPKQLKSQEDENNPKIIQA